MSKIGVVRLSCEMATKIAKTTATSKTYDQLVYKIYSRLMKRFYNYDMNPPKKEPKNHWIIWDDHYDHE